MWLRRLRNRVEAVASWRKLLARMVSDPDPREYTYDQAARVLDRLGFTLAPVGGGSPRKWRYRSPDGTTVVVVGLVDRGSGTLKPIYIREMVQQLQANGLLPSDAE